MIEDASDEIPRLSEELVGGRTWRFRWVRAKSMNMWGSSRDVPKLGGAIALHMEGRLAWSMPTMMNDGISSLAHSCARDCEYHLDGMDSCLL